MKTNLPINSWSPSRTARVLALKLALGVVGAVYPVTAAHAADLPKLLEQAIYSEDSKGDLDSAMQLYQQIVTDGNASQAVAAQAQFRLAMCYDKKKDYPGATAAFEKLIHDFPAQKEYVSLAQEYLSAGLPLQPAPWTEGEEMVIQLKAITGARIGLMKCSVASGQVEGQKTWNFRTDVFTGAHQITTAVVDANSLKPLRAEVNAGKLAHFTVKYGTGSADVAQLGQSGSKRVEITSPVYDNEEFIHLVRRLPLTANYKGSVRLLAAMAGGTIIPLDLQVVGQEKVTTPAGTFDTFKISSSIGQTYWYSSDAHHYLVKLEALGATGELLSVGTRSNDAKVTYHDAALGFRFDAPPGSMAVRREDEGNTKASTVLIGDPEGRGLVMIKVMRAKDFAPTVSESSRAFAEFQNQEGKRWYKELTPRIDSWTESKLGDQPAVGCTLDGVQNDGSAVVIVDVFAVIGDKLVDISVMAAAEDIEKLRPAFASIVASYRAE